MAVIQVNGTRATVKDFKWSCEDKELQEFLQDFSDLAIKKIGYGYFTKASIDNWVADYMAEKFLGEVLFYDYPGDIDYSEYPPGTIF